jgi:hypothetical protein
MPLIFHSKTISLTLLVSEFPIEPPSALGPQHQCRPSILCQGDLRHGSLQKLEPVILSAFMDATMKNNVMQIKSLKSNGDFPPRDTVSTARTFLGHNAKKNRQLRRITRAYFN